MFRADVYTTTQTQKKWFSEAARTLVSQLRSSVYTPLDRDMYYSDVSMGYICKFSNKHISVVRVLYFLEVTFENE